MAFEVLELSIDVCKQLRPVLQQIQEHDTRLARQLRDAASSCPLNIAEGNRRRGRDRKHHFRIAYGSEAEAQTALRVAEAFGYLDAEGSAELHQAFDRVQAMLRVLTRE